MMTTRQRSKRRGNQRGVVYIESLLVTWVLLIVFATSVFISAAYKSKLESFDFATSVSFRNAELGCGPPLGGSYSIGTLLGKAPTSFTAPDPAYLGGAVKGPTATSSTPIGSPVLFPGKTFGMAVSSQILCNEVPISKTDAWTALGAKDWAVNGVLAAAGFP